MIYQQPVDKAREQLLAELLATAWRCEAVPFPALSPIDWYLHRGSRLVALVEFRLRPNRSRTEFATVFLNAPKFWALYFSSLAFGVPACFVIGFTDGLFYVDVRQLPGTPLSVRGRTDRDDPHDVQPCLEIPSQQLRRVCALDWTALSRCGAEA